MNKYKSNLTIIIHKLQNWSCRHEKEYVIGTVRNTQKRITLGEWCFECNEGKMIDEEQVKNLL
jgi:hypothetical protein